MPLLLCDLDETLLDRTATFRRWAQALVAELDLDRQLVAWLIEEDDGGHRPKTDFVAAVSERLHPAVSLDVQTFRSDFARMFRCSADVAAALVDARRRGWQVAVVTNGSHTQLDKVAASGFGELVDVVCVSEVEGCRKPDPELLHIAADRAGASLRGAWMIGDDPAADIGAAAAAGVSSIWLHRGRVWTIREFGPTTTADTIVEALAVATGGRR